MTEPTLVSLFVPPINRLGIPYMVTGAVAAVVYGEPRLTRDIDLVIGLRSTQSRRFAAAWPDSDFYVPPPEAIKEETGRASGGHFNVAHHETAMRADVYLAGTDELMRWGLERAVAHDVDGEPVRFAPVEYVIVSKLRFCQQGGSERHLRDIAGMLSVSGEAVEREAVAGWARRYGVMKQWRKAQAFRP